MKCRPAGLGTGAYYVSQLLYKTLVVERKAHRAYQSDKPYLFAFWHGKQWLPILELTRHQTERAVLISASRDGDILSRWLQKMGYAVIRGSSRHQNISALKNMIRFLNRGYSLGFGIDGPVGPRYVVKPGMTHMAQKCGIEIIPVGSAFSNKWIFSKAWDRYEIPKPFARAAVYLGCPLSIDVAADLAACNTILEERIHAAEVVAERLLGDS